MNKSPRKFCWHQSKKGRPYDLVPIIETTYTCWRGLTGTKYIFRVVCDK